MTRYLHLSAGAIVLLAGVGTAAAQTTGVATTETVEITPTQRTTIYQTVTREHVVPVAPSGWEVRVGSRVPATVELHAFPQTVVTEVPRVKRYKYMVVNNQVVLVDPATSEVVEVIHD